MSLWQYRLVTRDQLNRPVILSSSPCCQGDRSCNHGNITSNAAHIRFYQENPTDLSMDSMTDFFARLHQQDQLFTNVPGSYVNEAYTSRMPELLRDCVADNSEILSKEQSKRLLKLADDLINDTEIPLPSQFASQGPTGAEWEKTTGWQELHVAELTPAVHVLPRTSADGLLHDRYRSIPRFVRYFKCLGSAQLIDVTKVAELKGETLWSLLQSAVDISTKNKENSQSRHDQLKPLMKLSMWGNKADGCNKHVKNTVSGTGASFDDELLLVDHRDKIVAYLEQKAKSSGVKTLGIQFINDNSGTELMLDLALADHLLENG
ncbi:hypothetical protein P3T76_011155 [Phytophthora citrophthora]|uniref:Sugar phosphate phosphatase n=1 Tax=Phytophthora citrophthora TaxID=4793 RepID=A0AAD9G9X1_9STRA|nr:hypothetical protein P3T76_011155 [Phytophthora citrophthora]